MQNSATSYVKRKPFEKRENIFSAQVFPTEEETQVAQILGLEGVGQVNKIHHFNVNTRLMQQIYLLHFFLYLTLVCIRVKLFIGPSL